MSYRVSINGQWFEKGSARARQARLCARHPSDLDVRMIFSAGDETTIKIRSISDRLGAVERRLELSDGSVFLTGENDAVDALTGLPRGRFSQVHELERFHPNLLVFVVAIALPIFASIRWGLPATAKVAAWLTPTEMKIWIDTGSLATIDRLFVDESDLDEEIRKEIKQRFLAMVKANDVDQRYRLQFRSSDAIGPNALALPGGIIIVTDSLVDLVTGDELQAALAHEIAHVDGSHGLQQFYRALGFAGLMSVVAGDLGFLSEELMSGGGILVAMAASRQMELEADRDAVPLLRKMNIDPHKLSQALDKLYSVQCRYKPEDCKTPGWLSSHPGGEERRKALLKHIEMN